MEIRQIPPSVRGSDLLRELAAEGLEVSERQLAHWRLIRLLQPTRTGTHGCPWRYGERDQLVVLIIALSRARGVSTQAAQRALRMLDDIGGIPRHGAIEYRCVMRVWRALRVFGCERGPALVGGDGLGVVVVW